MQFQRKKNRLPGECYTGQLRVSLTICAENGKKAFVDKKIVDFNVKELKIAADKHKQIIWAYCYMPDHLHILTESSEDGDIVKFVKAYKQNTGFEYKKNDNSQLWQKGYFDHILRKEEALGAIVRYIFENPIRKGLVKDFLEYPFLGSLVEDNLFSLIG